MSTNDRTDDVDLLDELADPDDWPAAAKAEIDRLRKRLAAAEQVCILYSWSAASSFFDVDKAVMQAWMDWKHAYDPVASRAGWSDRIAELARRRDEIRAATLRKIRGESA